MMNEKMMKRGSEGTCFKIDWRQRKNSGYFTTANSYLAQW